MLLVGATWCFPPSSCSNPSDRDDQSALISPTGSSDLITTVPSPIQTLGGATPRLPPGRIYPELLRSRVASVRWSHLGGRMKLVGGEKRSPFLRVDYPAGKWGSHDSGAQIMFDLPAADVATARYRVRFAEDFEFVKGGKLPGLCGGTATTGNRRPDGDGWSARLMWRRHGDAVLYLYHLDQETIHAEDFPLDVRFERGRWYTIEQRIGVNRDGKKDGHIQIFVDGKMTLDLRSVRLRSGNQAPIDRFYFSTFFGGGDQSWAPKSDQTIDFADFQSTVLKPADPQTTPAVSPPPMINISAGENSQDHSQDNSQDQGDGRRPGHDDDSDRGKTGRILNRAPAQPLD